MSLVPSTSSLILVDARTGPKIFILPRVALNIGKIFIFKDYYGMSYLNTITIKTQESDLIDDYNTQYILSNLFSSVTFIGDGLTSWRVMSRYVTIIPYPPTNLLLSINSITGIATISYTGGVNAVSYFWTLYQGTTNDYTTGAVYSSGTTTSRSFTTPINGSGYLYYTIYSINSIGVSSVAVSPLTQSTYYSNLYIYDYVVAGDQYFTAPQGVTSVTVHLWGGGGGGDNSDPARNNGGAGAYVTGTLAITPGLVYIVMAAQGGTQNGQGGVYGGGGVNFNNYSNPQNGQGGGRSAIREPTNTTDLVDAGGGGGGGGGYTQSYGGGAAYWNGTSQSGQGPYPGTGGGQGFAGQAGGQGQGQAFGYNDAGLYRGGTPNGEAAGSGGGGWYGGGGGGANNPRGPPPGTSSGGGGGSSYTGGISNASGANSPDYYTAPGQNIIYYKSGIAAGGIGQSAGGNGRVVIVIGTPPPPPPSGLSINYTLVSGTTFTLTLSWTAYPNATLYSWTLYTNLTSTFTGKDVTSGTTTNNTVNVTVTGVAYYYFTLKATYGGVLSFGSTSTTIATSVI